MTRSRDTGGPRRAAMGEASGATSPVSGQDRPAKAPGLALPADLGRSLRLLDDEQLDRLVKAAFEEARRRGRDVPDNTSVAGGRSARPIPAKPAREDTAAAVTPGQERLILAAVEAGLNPAAIAREFRLSRATVQHVINVAQRARRKTER